MNINILMVGWELPPYNSGGLGEACFGLAKALSRKGVKITFVLPRKLDVEVDFMNLVYADIGEKADLLKSSYTTHQSLLAQKFKLGSVPSHDFVNAALEFAERIGTIAKKFRGDIVHAHDWLTYPAGIAAKEAIHTPLVAHVHSTEVDRTGGHNLNSYVYNLERLGVEAADVVVPVSKFTQNILETRYGVNSDKIEVVYNGIEKGNSQFIPPALESFKKQGYKIVLFLGRITLMKGPEYFVRTAKRILEYEKKTIFVVTGSGDMLPFMLAEAARLGVLDKFIFTGFLRGEERDRIFKSADIYVMPSVSEPFGIAPLEAIANGTPVLVSKQSGVSEVLQHALKADFWDIDEMANKIIGVLRYGALGQDLRWESGKEIKNVNWEKAADKCISIYQHLLH